ncbi:MAG: TVP38/TMEM64 family protein [Gammaproteobacteria bacterium]|nr:TVP38/TMEM64 family protein [Gammaproteobacteria bacterium]
MNKRKFFRWLLAIVIVSGIAGVFLYRDNINVDELKLQFEQLGGFAPLIFIAVYTLGTLLFLPGSLLTLTGGVLFGPVWGTLYNLTGATLGATLAFLVSRYLGADWVSNKASGWLQKILDGVKKEGWRFVAFTRLVPLFPFNILNYVLGLTGIRLLPYFMTTWICMIPGAFVYTWIGYTGREAATGGGNLLQNILIALALLAVAIYLPRVVTKFRNSDKKTSGN